MPPAFMIGLPAPLLALLAQALLAVTPPIPPADSGPPSSSSQPAPNPAAPIQPAPDEPPPAPSPAQPADPRDAADFLHRLEAEEPRLGSLSAGFSAEKSFFIVGDSERRTGTLAYLRLQAPPSPDVTDPAAPAEPAVNRRLAVRITQTVIGRRLETNPEEYVYADGWLVERRPADRSFTKRQVAPPGEPFDPFELRSGTLAIPIAQQARAVLERFDASLPPAAQGLEDQGHLEYVNRHAPVQLRLVPKEGTPDARDLREIRVWYRPFDLPDGSSVHVPVITRIAARSGDIDTYLLFDVRPNAPIDPAAFSIAPPPRDEPWSVHIQPWREAIR